MGMLRLDWNVVATIINLLVLYWLMRKFLYRPILNIMEQRKKLIDTQFQEAKDVQTKADDMKVQYEEFMEQAKEESEKILEQARVTANAEYESRLESAKAQTTHMLEGAKEKVEMEREKTFHELESQIASLALTAARKVLNANTSEQFDKAIYNQFLSEAGEMHDPNHK